MKKHLLSVFLILNATFLIPNCSAQYTKLLDFSGTNGSSPWGSLISDGIFLYGMTYSGGTNNLGTIFKIKPDGTGYADLIDFTGTTNGSYPRGSLFSDGTFLYGMTYMGGTNNLGTIFKIKTDGTGYVKLLDFSGATNGSSPWGTSLISDGTFLYGMTSGGGINGNGIIFKIKPDGTGDTTLLDFNATNGGTPFGSLISDGTFLYGMTYYGGTYSMGTIFKIMPDGTGYSKLLDFSGATNGSVPEGSLISDGTFLYGMTYSGGTSDKGVLFKIKPDGTGYAKLLNFNTTNGMYPFGSLISDGIFLYGMVSNGGTKGMGIIFKIKPDGTGYAKLLDFAGAANGSYPRGSLVSDGTFLYGMTGYGGTNGTGTIFKTLPCTAITFTLSPTLCTGQSVTVGSNTYTTSGTYTDILTSYQGCDSTVTTNLTVNDTSVSVSNATLTANASPATYQWIDCNNANAPIAGQTNQSFTATTNGNYAVIVTQNSCSDTSACYSITTVGIVENSFASGITISPNPFTSQTTITFTQEQKNTTIKIMDVLGKEVKTVMLSGAKTLTLEKGELKEGIYFVHITDVNNNVVNRKIVVQ